MRRLALPLAALACLLAQETSEKKPGLPLKTERKLDFTTDEGTWLSVDVSPDGKTIAFDLLGDLYTLPIEGGEAKPIVTGLSFDGQPKYSPDGKLIAFTSDRDGSDNLWIAKADGSDPKQLSKDKDGDFISPSWTPDGEFVVVSRCPQGLAGHEIWMYDINGGSGVQVTKSAATPQTPNNQRLNFLGPIVSPDGKFFYYARRTQSFTYNVTFPLWQVVRRDRTTGDEDVITSEPESAFRPVLSPDGKKLVYGTRFEQQTGLKIRDLETGEERWLKYPVQRDDQESRATRDVLPGYAFTPDGKEVVAFFGGKINRIQVATGESKVVPFNAHVALDLGPELKYESRIDESPIHARLIQGAAQSPDGKNLAFSSLTHLYEAEIPAGKPARLTSASEGEYLPSWSPKGDALAYVTWSSTGGGQIWKKSAGGQPQQLTHTAAYYQDPVWSPDGTRIVALRTSRQARIEGLGGFGGQQGMDVVWIPSAGGDATVIVPARGSGKPHFTHDPDRVYVYSGQRGLQSFRWDGTDRRTHLKVVGKNLTGAPEPPPAQDVQMSPDSRHALALVNNQLYLLASVPVTGGDAPTVNISSPSVPIKKLTDVGADTFGWADDGKTITWSLGSSFFRMPLAAVSFDADKKVTHEEFAMDIEAPRYVNKGTVVLRGAKLITMRGEEIIPDGEIIVTDNRIASVGRRGSLHIPSGAKVIDVKGATIMPGIVDVHAHWTEIRRGVLDPESWPFLANLAYGVTTGRDPQTGSNDTFAYQDLIDMGEMLGPRAFSTGPGIFSNNDFQSLDEAVNTVTRYKKYYRTNTVKSYTVGNRKQREWVVEACKQNGIMPTTEGALDLKLDLTHAIDGMSGNEHALPIVPLYKDVVDVFAKSGISYTPTLIVAYGGPWAENYFYTTTEVHHDPKLRRFLPHNVLDEKSLRRPWFAKEEQVFPKLAESAARIVRAGGRVCIGGHGQIQGIQCHWEMWALQSGGLSNFEVLKAATISGAQAIGYAHDLGSLEQGKLADLIVLNKDPLQDIHNTNTIRYVMKGGQLFEGDTLNEVWPQQKPLPQLWWWNEKP
ncbi:MAG TPA: amidohydrolase family protein [Bryobacteraceae bacterium]|nr:amidohydrolase family protein [Bryobacteraceae bacterium]